MIPGDSDKLLFMFQGGGACWDSVSTKTDLCTQGAYPDDMSGILDRTNNANPFKSYTVVEALYCSGDAFVANNKTQSYTTSGGDVAVQTGQQNVVATIEWVQANLGMDAKLSNLAISGWSAGALGAQAWSDALLTTFPAEQQEVIPDSYIGLFPDGTQGPVLKETWPVCDGGFLQGFMSNALIASCEAETITMQEWLLETMAEHSEVPFSFIQSKYDATQTAFYAAIATTFLKLPIYLSSAEFYSKSNDIFLMYHDSPNEVHFLIDSSQHCYTPYSLFYTADTAGPRRFSSMMADWTATTIGTPSSTSTQCDGELEPEPSWSGTSYCDETMAGKVFPATEGEGSTSV